MEYIKRNLEAKFIRLNGFFKAILLSGARQVGKTTMLRRLAKDGKRNYVTLDDLAARNLARADPPLFFQTYKPPLTIDEAQYAPELFGQIKIICDQGGERGLFWLTGSQQFSMMKNIRETLAGRIGLLELFSFSKNEKEGLVFEDELDFSLAALQARQAIAGKNDIGGVFEHIWRGGMPQLLKANAEEREEYYRAYFNTYLMRDVAELGGVTDVLRFANFLAACAALVGEQVNYKTLAEAAGITQPTARGWLRLLESLGIIYLLRPFAHNALKRLAKTPKLYFCDTGLAAHLAGWLTRETLMNGAAAGHYFENHVIAELVKNYACSRSRAELSYYRDANAKEIDIFVERGNAIHPLEIKKTASPHRGEVKKFSVLDKLSLRRGEGGVICLCEEVVPIDDKNCFIPCNLI